MNIKNKAVFLGYIVVSIMFLTSCSVLGNRSKDNDANAKVYKVGLIAPLSGSLSAQGLGIKNSADLAIKEINKKHLIKGVKFELDAQDDQANPTVAQNAANVLIKDPTVIGIAGTLNSSTAQVIQPILAQNHIPLISFGNTSISLTAGPNPEAPKRPFDNYFRLVARDDFQGEYAAKYIYNTLNIHTVATIHDKKTYGQGLVDAFTKSFKALGGNVSLADTINPGEKDYSAAAQKVKNSGAQLIYYGGEYPEAELLTDQVKQLNSNIHLFGGDGIYDDSYIDVAKKHADGDYVTNIGLPIDKLDQGKQFLDLYKKEHYKEEQSAYGPLAYDAVNTIINAFHNINASTDKTKLINAIQSIQFDGISGHVSFDQYGDTLNKRITLYQVNNDKWTVKSTQ